MPFRTIVVNVDSERGEQHRVGQAVNDCVTHLGTLGGQLGEDPTFRAVVRGSSVELAAALRCTRAWPSVTSATLQ